MDISLPYYGKVSLDQLQNANKFPCLLTKCRIFLERPLLSGCLSFYRERRRRPVSLVRCSYLDYELKPRPVPRHVLTDHDTKKESKMEDTPNETSCSLGICSQIEQLVLHRKYKDALELFEILESEDGYDVGCSTYDALINACISLNSVRGTKRVFNHMMCSGLEPDLYLRNRVLLMHVKCGMMIDARKLFSDMRERNLVSWNTIIGGLVDSGDYLEAFELFLILWVDFSDVGSRTLATMIRAAAGIEIISPGRQLHSCAVKMGISKDVFVSCALIDMYSKCGSIEDAQFVFDHMPEKTTVGWNTIIAGHALHGYSEEALSLYYEMQDCGVKMDNFTFSMIIRVCTRLASLEHAKQAHAGLIRHGFGLDIVANTALVDFYSKWGRIEDAQNVFEHMPQKNVISWNALIAGYGKHGQGIEAVRLFQQMVDKGMIPNHVTFLAVLSACSYSGLSDEGWEIFDSMTMVHKVKPRAMHYACMIELLGREGLLDQAVAMIRGAPFRPTLNMWSALLTACRFHKNLVLGKFAAEKIYEMEPEKLSNYVTLMNIYFRCGNLNEVAAVVQTLKRKGLRMLPVCTWIEIKKQTHVFLSRDKCNVQTKDIYNKLEKLMMEISKIGYAPEGNFLLPDVDEQEQRMSQHHSEKLAISFGLISTSRSTPLHLVQSHRICNDCHDAIKLIAMVTSREIIVRDGSRFHRFRHGICSCGDYW